MTGVYRSYALAIYLELAGIVGLDCRIAVIDGRIGAERSSRATDIGAGNRSYLHGIYDNYGVV